jgi:4-amino-4-deoxy-L-arabinose transferase-like glycosyltransferase
MLDAPSIDLSGPDTAPDEVPSRPDVPDVPGGVDREPACRWWVPALLAVFVAGLVLRVLFAVVWATPLGLIPGDERFYQFSGQAIADGHGYEDTLMGSSGPTAAHPPLFSVLIAGLDRVGLSPRDHAQSIEPLRIALAVVCATVIPLAGLLGRRLAGPRVGIVTAVIAAFHPLWVQNGPNLWPEGLYLVLVTGLLLLAVRAIDRPSWARALALGAAIGLAALTRSEGVVFLLVVGVPVVLVAVRRWRQRLRLGVLITLATLAVITPWLVRNYTLLDSVTMSTQDGITLGGSNCDNTYYGEHLGGFDFDCSVGYSLRADSIHGRSSNQAVESGHIENVALDYVGDHMARLPVVVGARVLRSWSLYKTGDQLEWDVGERRNRTFQTVGQYVEWTLLAFGAAGALLLPKAAWRRWIVVAAGPVLATLLAAGLYGGVRLRVVAEPSVALFAAYGFVVLLDRVRAYASRPRPS